MVVVKTTSIGMMLGLITPSDWKNFYRRKKLNRKIAIE